jgi:murein DD-endopeptidase MepM/ murein hydrolase activator NlpD
LYRPENNNKYGGECNQGGNFVIIKHTNGMYSLYFHLKKYLVKVGDNVKRGEQIGISGNSGKANCQPLGYHLHFELRKGLASSTHVNPVEYIDIDWNQISTLGISKYKGRLSGENPHPNF